jgi:hypothetical protein
MTKTAQISRKERKYFVSQNVKTNVEVIRPVSSTCSERMGSSENITTYEKVTGHFVVNIAESRSL